MVIITEERGVVSNIVTRSSRNLRTTTHVSLALSAKMKRRELGSK